MRKQELHPRTAIINNKQKNSSKLARLQALRWLAERFPQAFDNRVSIQPLKMGIMSDILAYSEEAKASGISKSKLREAVVVFTRRLDYLACLKAREMRVDLSGQAVGEVTEEEAERAAAKIKKRIEKGVKNARKQQASSQISSSQSGSRAAPAWPQSFKNEEKAVFPSSYYNDNRMNNAFEAYPSTSPATVVVKHKLSRSYDPEAVARLKEKLGLSRVQTTKNSSSD